MSAIVNVKIIPRYTDGFMFVWELDPANESVGTWKFTIEEAESTAGPWVGISGELTNKYFWVYANPRKAGKDMLLYYRVKGTINTDTHISDVIMPYGDLNKREWLIAKEIIRKELLVASKFEGITGLLYQVSTFGPKCTVCRDPITGTIRSGKCSTCFGTGRNPGYHGPIPVWLQFSNKQAVTAMKEAGTGTIQPAEYKVRVIGAPPTKTNDILIDTRSDKRYYIAGSEYIAEIRRIPILQEAAANEAPLSDIIYKVGT